MTEKKYEISKKDDLRLPGHSVVGAVKENIVGTWKNTNTSIDLIEKVVIEQKGEAYFFHITGIPKSGVTDWGKANCIPYYTDIHADTIEGFTITFNLATMKVDIFANVKYGVLVLQSFTQMTEDRSANQYFGPEFYVRVSN